MKNKIAIFSGAIPSSPFIERLIEGVANDYQVLLFGVIEKKKNYKSKNVKIYNTPNSHTINLIFTLKRLSFLFLKSPRDVVALFKEVSKYKRLYDQWIWFSKFLPIVLYKPDVFHMQWTRDLEFYTFLKTRFKIPIVVSLRGAHMHYTPIVHPYIADIYKVSFPIIDRFHAVSESMKFTAQEYGAGSDLIKVIHSPLPDSVFERFKVYKKKNIPLRIGSVGRFHWIKGMRYALDACSILNSQNFDFSYTIISSDLPNEETLLQLHQFNLMDKVNIMPEQTQDQLFDVMASFDILVLPSLDEGIANVVLEAMAIGIPVVSSNCGGMSEVIQPNSTGWLVPTRDAKAIAKAIVTVSETSELELQRITQNAHNLVKANFNSEQSISEFLNLYEQTMKNV